MPDAQPLRATDRRRVGRYRLTGRLDLRPVAGQGSPGRVFVATGPGGSTVIVALLDRVRVAGQAARDRFTAEAMAARRIAPFCIVRILDAGIEDDDPYLVTEYAAGPSLTEVIESEGRLPEPLLAAVGIGMVTGLAAIHQAGLVHGEFGAGHVVLGPDGPRVIHFSITPPYGKATPAADMLAWAQAILFAAGASARRPGHASARRTGQAGGGSGAVAALPGWLHAAVFACLAPGPSSRPTARAVLAQLLGQYESAGGLLAEGASHARMTQAPARAAQPGRREHAARPRRPQGRHAG